MYPDHGEEPVFRFVPLPDPPPPASNFESDSLFRLLHWKAAPQTSFQGKLDEVAIYRGVLSEAEILDHYNDGYGKPYDEPSGPTPSPNYHWHYEYDGLSRLASDCSDWDAGTSSCLGDSFNYSYDGAGNLLSFSRWSGTNVETMRFV